LVVEHVVAVFAYFGEGEEAQRVAASAEEQKAHRPKVVSCK